MNVRVWRIELLALILGALPWSTAPGLAQQIGSQAKPQSLETNGISATEHLADRHYVEFRVARIGAYGHSYVVFGSAHGRANYADLHPMGGYAVMALGHVLPVPANTEWDPDVLRLPVSARFRRSLSAQQYHALLAAIRAAKLRPRYWNAVTNNCNHFVAELAQAIGLRIPGAFQVSYSFVPALRALNESAR